MRYVTASDVIKAHHAETGQDSPINFGFLELAVLDIAEIAATLKDWSVPLGGAISAPDESAAAGRSSDSPWVVRETTPDDLDAVMDLTEEVAAEGRWIATEPGFDRAERKARVEASLGDPNAGNFVADAGGVIVGSAGIDRKSVAVPASFGMMVAAGWRGRGIGSALLVACIEWARAVGAHKVALDAWPHNEAAIALYRKFGFVQEGHLVKHYRRANGELWDSVEMGLLL